MIIMETLIRDLKYALRRLAAQPAFTLITLGTLALGIGASTTIFSVVYGIVLKPLAYKQPDRLAMVWMDNTRIKLKEDWHSWPNYIDYRDQNSVFEDIAAFNNRSFNLTNTGEPLRILGAWNTANLFTTLGVDAVVGRTFSAEEEQAGKDMVAVIGYGLWQRRFGGDADIVGKDIYLNDNPRKIIGVMPRGFAFPQKETELWVPMVAGRRAESRGAFWLQAIGRLKPGVTVAQAQTDMTVIADRLQQQFPDALLGYGVNIVGYHDQLVGRVKPALLLLLGAVGFLLLIACANVANLLLARAAAREREIAIRIAVGASRRKLVRQLLTESVLLGILGGVPGVVLAIGGLRILSAVGPADLPRLDQVHISWQVLIFSVVISLATGLLFGIAPALQASKSDLNESLKEGGRGNMTGLRGKHIRSALIIGEIAIALLLLTGAGLMVKSFLRLQELSLGFDPNDLLTTKVQVAGSKYRDGPAVAGFYKRLTETIESVPGIESVGAISTIFLSETPNSSNFSIDGRPDFRPEERVEVPIDSVTPTYFQTMKTRLIAGRFFDSRDVAGAPEVAIINATMAERFWPDSDPIGGRIKYGSISSQDTWKTIVGVVDDVRRTGYDRAVRCETFLPHAQSPASGMTLVLRSRADRANLISAIRATMNDIDAGQPVYDFKSMDTLLGEMVAQRRLNTLLFSVFGIVALTLASVGVYGVMSYTVSQRMHELGLRIALGASPFRVLRLVLQHCMTLAAAGVVAGLLASVALTRFMASLLYGGVSPTDVVTFSVITAGLLAVALGACVVPALRATKVDPMTALRCE